MSTPHRIVVAPELAPPSGYAHAVIAQPGRTVHLGGHTALDQTGRIIGVTFAEQFERALSNLLAALRAAGGQPQHLVSMVIYVTDMDAYRLARRALRDIWAAQLGTHYPALATIGVRELYDREATVELMGVAVVP